MPCAAISKPIDVTQYENSMSSVSAPDGGVSSGESTDESEASAKEAVEEDKDLPTPTPATSDRSTALTSLGALKAIEHDIANLGSYSTATLE